MIASLKFLRNNPDTLNQNNINMLCFGGYTGKLIDSLFVKPSIEMVNIQMADAPYIEDKVAPFNDILKQITITKKDEDDDDYYEDVNILEGFKAVRYQGGKIKKKTNNKRKKNKTHKRIKNKRNKKTNKRRNKTNKK
jgi:hypothetical protein